MVRPASSSLCVIDLITCPTAIKKEIDGTPGIAIAIVIEPDALGDVVVNANLSEYRERHREYKEGITYALRQLSSLSNVAIYLDATHGGFLGWDDNLGLNTAIFAQFLPHVVCHSTWSEIAS
jgi:cellulase/cellobiase CelA1